jgi:hypothetical protein
MTKTKPCDACGALPRGYGGSTGCPGHCPARNRIKVRGRNRSAVRPCAECIRLLDPVTGASPGCDEHRPQPRVERSRPERPEAERVIDALRAAGTVGPAYDLRW